MTVQRGMSIEEVKQFVGFGIVIYPYCWDCGLGEFHRWGGFESAFIVDFRINGTLQIGAVRNSAYQTWGVKVFIYFLNSLYLVNWS